MITPNLFSSGISLVNKTDQTCSQQVVFCGREVQQDTKRGTFSLLPAGDDSKQQGGDQLYDSGGHALGDTRKTGDSGPTGGSGDGKDVIRRDG